MIRTFTCTLLLFVLLACKKDRKIEPGEPAGVKLTGLLKSVTVLSDAGETKLEYSYEDSLTLKSIRHTHGGKSTVETFTYEKDTLRSSQVGDTLRKYFYWDGRLSWVEKHVTGQTVSYEILSYVYFSDGLVSTIEKRAHNYNGTNNRYIGSFAISWQGKNISTFRERYTNGLIEDYYFQYGEPRNPFTRLYAETLRIPSEDPYALSYNSPTGYTSFVAGMKYKVEGKYLENRLPLSQTISEFNIEKGGDWKMIKQYTFEYYE